MNAINRHPVVEDDDLDDQARDLRDRAAAGERLCEYDRWYLASAEKAALGRAAKRDHALVSQGAETRLAALEAAVEQLQRYGYETFLRNLIAQVIADTLDDAPSNAEDAVKKTLAAVEERFTVELACTADELRSKIDSKTWGFAALVDWDPRRAEKAAGELRADLERRFSETSALIDTLAERIDGVDRRRRYDRNTAHKEKDEAAEKILALFGAMIARTDKRVAEIAEELRALRAILVEHEIVAPDQPTVPLLLAESLGDQARGLRQD
jgi:hypothetical protein